MQTTPEHTDHATFTPEQLAALSSLIEGYLDERPLVLHSEWLNNKFGFNDGDLFDELVDQLVEIEGVAAILPKHPGHDLIEAVAYLVLLPELEKMNDGVELALWGTAHNPVRIACVGGLSENESSLQHCSVALTSDQLLAALEAVAARQHFATPAFDRPSALVDGLEGMVGRHVEVSVGALEDDAVVGTLFKVDASALILGGADNWGGDFIQAVPISTVRAIKSYQLTRDEAQRLGLRD